MEYRTLGETGLQASVIGLGTWVMGGWLWGGANENESLATIREALDLGVNLIDTAPIYGHGLAEELVGKALRASGQRDRVILATKVGLEWDTGKTKVWRNSSRARILKEIRESLHRLETDYVDLYQVHWPDTKIPFHETMETLLELQQQKIIRFIGVSNFSLPQLQECLAVGPVHSYQPPFNLFERKVEQELLPFCLSHHIGTLVYGPLCRGLLSGKYQGHERFSHDDIRASDPKFVQPRFDEYVTCVNRLRPLAQTHGKTIGQLAIRWCLDQSGVTVALCGARSPEQIRENVGAADWLLPVHDRDRIREMVDEIIVSPIGPEFMGPP